MKKHVRAMTYPPKISAIRSGECRQTIRIGNKVSEGDEILWHGWEGLPYRSKWSWRKRVTITEVVPLLIDYVSGIIINDTIYHESDYIPWDNWYANELAQADYIDPPTGVALRDVLAGLGGKMVCEEYQIIRW